MSALITNPWKMSLRTTPIGRSTKEWAWAGAGKNWGKNKNLFSKLMYYCTIKRQLSKALGSKDPLCEFWNSVVQGLR